MEQRSVQKKIFSELLADILVTCWIWVMTKNFGSFAPFGPNTSNFDQKFIPGEWFGVILRSYFLDEWGSDSEQMFLWWLSFSCFGKVPKIEPFVKISAVFATEGCCCTSNTRASDELDICYCPSLDKQNEEKFKKLVGGNFSLWPLKGTHLG